MRILILVIGLTLQTSAHSQTVGTLNHEEGTASGLNLLNPIGHDRTYLIDNCGRVINDWMTTRPNGMYAEITPEGTLLKSAQDELTTFFEGGGANGYIQEYGWNGFLTWEYKISDATHRAHHDMELLANGNLLVIAWEQKSRAECIAAGADTNLLHVDGLWTTVIYELERLPFNSANIVWEWHAFDHLVQDFDASQQNYGVLSANPNKINFNYAADVTNQDWAHVNGIDYNQELDHIVLSSPRFNELWIIEHSTTTQEAAGSTGGNRGKGGDLLWRWGNPITYGQGMVNDQQLKFQHNSNWVERGTRYLDMISVYSNRDDDNGNFVSRVKIIDAAFDTINNEYPIAGSFLPLVPEYTYQLVDSLFSPRVSGVQVQENDNLLITSGNNGHHIEVDTAEVLKWNYLTPIYPNGTIANQGDVLSNSKSSFVMERYPMDFQGFNGQSLAPGSTIELGGFNCEPVEISSNLFEDLSVVPNPLNTEFSIEGGKGMESVRITDAQGRTIFNQEYFFGTPIDSSSWEDGLYYLQIGESSLKLIKH